MDFVGAVIRNKIKELGQLWKSSENHVNVSIDVLNSWDTLISEWAEDESMPLIIRKGSSRGQEFTHPSGRKVIISDNTFALCTGDKTNCERTKCECEASVTANQ